MNKKKAELPLTIIIVALILITTAVIVLAVFSGLFRQEGTEIENKITGVGDYDLDGVVNMFDKCPCVEGDDEYDGCGSEEILDDKDHGDRSRDCLKSKS